jgi:hypothetical protein
MFDIRIIVSAQRKQANYQRLTPRLDLKELGWNHTDEFINIGTDSSRRKGPALDA